MQPEDNAKSVESTADLFIVPILFVCAVIAFVALISLI